VKIGPADPEILRFRASKSSTTQNWLPWQCPLRYEKKISDLSSAPKTLSYGVIIAKIARGLRFAYDTKLAAMAMSLEESEKLDLIKKIHANTFHLVKRS